MLHIRFSLTMVGSCCAVDIGGKLIKLSHMVYSFLFTSIVGTQCFKVLVSLSPGFFYIIKLYSVELQNIMSAFFA